MNNEDEGRSPLERLPKEYFDSLSHPIARFLKIESFASLLLLICVITSIAIANSSLAEYFHNVWGTKVGIQFGYLEIERTLKECINDGLMTFFFFLVSLELKRELVLGELKNPKLAALSIAAALGGMLVPAALYLLIQQGQSGDLGWGVVMATDTAVVIACLMLLGNRIPQSLRVFMLSLAIFDDVGAILVVAFGYSTQIHWVAVAMAALGLVVVRLFSVAGVRSLPVYFLAGAFIWLAIDESGIHPTVTGIVLGLMTPAIRWVDDKRLYAILDRVISHPGGVWEGGDTRDRSSLQIAEVAARESLSPVERLLLVLHPWVSFVFMPLFVLVNAGVLLAVENLNVSIASAVFLGLFLGKPLGVITFSWIAVRIGMAVRPPDLSWGLLMGGGLLAGIGFTMSLFIANLAFTEAQLGSAKLGIYAASLISFVAGMTVLFLLSKRVGPLMNGRSTRI